MDALLIILAVCVAIYFILRVVNSGSNRGVEPTSIRPFDTAPAGSRRRRRGGGFYPVGYNGPYYDDEDLVDELLFSAEIAAADALIDELVDERGTLAIEDETIEPVVEEREPEPDPIAVNDDDDIKTGSGSIFDGGGSDDSWGSGSDDSGGSWDDD